MQILVFTDLHITSHKNSLQRLQDCLDVLKWTFQTARERNIKDVLFLGDLFHDRQKIQIIAYHNTFKIFKEYDDLNIKLLLGNHDLWFYDKWDVSSVMPLSGLSHVEVIAEPTTLKIADLNIDFLPFTHNPIEILKQFNPKSPVLCGHIALDDAMLNSLYATTSEVSVENEKDVVKVNKEVFSEWKKVLLGHYHCSQKLDNVEYVGSPLQLNFNEAFQTKHIAILDTKTLQLEYVENTFSPKHLILREDEVERNNLDNCFVQIQVENIDSSNIIDLRKKITEESKTNSLEFKGMKTKNIQEHNETLQHKFDFGSGDCLEKYIKITNTDLDHKDLLNIGMEIINAN